MSRLVRVYAVVEVADGFDLDDQLAEITPAPEFVVWAVAREGYAGEFESLGADPSSWEIDAPRPVDRSRDPLPGLNRPRCSTCGRFCSIWEKAPPGDEGDIFACAVCDRAPAEDE